MMVLQAAEHQGSRPPPPSASADPRHLRRPVAAPPSLPTCDAGVGFPSRGSTATAARLPDGLLLEILSRLPAKPLFRFKCVSKAWSGLIAECLCKFPHQTLQGFFYGDDESCEMMNCGRFASLLGRRSVPPVDPSFSFLTSSPEIAQIILLRSCNGLLLFWHRVCSADDAGDDDRGRTHGYVVCNPATKEWVAVPASGWALEDDEGGDEDDDLRDWQTITHLIFDPAVSSQFKLVQFCHDFALNAVHVRTFSSETGVWSAGATGKCLWSDEAVRSCVGSAIVGGMLHLAVLRCSEQRDVIVAVDGEGEKCGIIRWPEEERGSLVLLGQSQGLLHCMSGHRDRSGAMSELSIWVLEDYGAERWILKGGVSCLQLFGEVGCCFHDSLIAVHPDHNLAFFVHRSSKKLVSYDMDSKEVSALSTLEHWCGSITPYIPYFGESSVLNKH